MTAITVTGPNGPTEIHAPNCRDLTRSSKFRPDDLWTLNVASRHELATEIWGDVASDTYDVDSPEWHATCDAWLDSEYRTMPCAPALDAPRQLA